MIERSFRFDENTYMQLKEIADVECVTVSQLVRLAVDRLLRQYIDGADLYEVVIND